MKKKIIYILIFITSIIILIIGWNKLQDYIFFHPWNDMISYKKLQEIDEFDNGFSAVSIRRMNRFYEYYPNWSTVLTKLSWAHFQG